MAATTTITRDSRTPSELTSVISQEEIPTCFYKTLTYAVSFDPNSSFFTFVSTTPAPINPNFSKSLDDLVAFKSDGDSWLSCFFIFRGENYLWRLVELQISFHPKSTLLEKWLHSFDRFLSGVFRPKHLLFVINPKCGNNSARKYFSSEVEPILRQIGVKYEVHQTNGQGDATQVVRSSTSSLSGIDGVVVMGGDGTFTEVVKGVLDPEEDSQIRPNDVCLGVIPSGTGNALAYSLHGNDDRETALLHVLIGGQRNIDVLSLKNKENKLLGVSLTMFAFGFFADGIKDSENYRKWLPGTLPYTFAFMKRIMKMSKYSCQMEISKSENPPFEQVVCKSNCESCSNYPESKEIELVSSEEPVIFGVQCHNHVSKTTMSPRGACLYGHFANGQMEVHVIRDVTRSEVGEMLKETGKSDSDKSDFDCVQAMRAKQLKLSFAKADENGQGESCFILDGEVFQQEDVTVTCHQRVLTIFGRGIEYDGGTKPEPLLDNMIQQPRNHCSNCVVM